MNRRLSRDDEADIRRRASAGATHRALGREYGVSHVTIGKVVAVGAAHAPDAPVPSAPAHVPHTTVPSVPTELLPDDTLGRLREMQRRYLERAERAEAAGDFTAAGRAGRDAATLAPVIARLERDAKTDDGTFTFTIADVQRVAADLKKKVADVQHRNFMCAECGRIMRRAEAEGLDLADFQGDAP
jgi:hypothetical protein